MGSNILSGGVLGGGGGGQWCRVVKRSPASHSCGCQLF